VERKAKGFGFAFYASRVRC